MALDATRIRELLLDFYTENDPQRLNMGLDIFSMVVWTQQNGLESLNDLLHDQYGKEIDPNKKLGGAGASFKRFSTLMSTDTAKEAVRRNQIYTALLKFYEEHDPSKIGRLNDFVQYIMLHGVSAFNRKLYAKYGQEIKGLEEDNKSRQTERTERSSMGSSFTLTSAAGLASKTGGGFGAQTYDEDDLPPPPPPLDDEAWQMLQQEFKEGESEEDVLRTKLTGYYAFYDPGKLAHVDDIVQWGLQIGEHELEAKLMQIYGAGFNKAIEDQKEKMEPSKPAGGFRTSISNKVSSMMGKKPVANKNPKSSAPPPMPPMPKPSHLPKTSTPNKPQVRAPPKKPTAPSGGIVRQDSFTNVDGPCNDYVLDMSGATFGVCACGYSRAAHMYNSPEMRHKNSNFGTKNRSQSNAPAPASQKNRKPAMKKQSSSPSTSGYASKHTPTYMYGKHSQSSLPRKVDVRSNAGEKGGDGPCNDFILDMSAGSFGVCQCGFQRGQHSSAAPAPHRGGFASNIKRVSKKVLGDIF